MSTEPATRRARTTCDDCGLPYYADENDACPYCETSASSSAADRAPTGTETEPQRDREPESATADRRRSSPRPSAESLLQRITNGLKDAFRR
ncbi:hypothetical protein [Halopiger thermotolerans]